MNPEDQLLDEMRRLHRRGLINDQEAIELRKLLKKSKHQPIKRLNPIEPDKNSEQTSE